ncbi:MAG: SDR family oxidoreductase [Phycisphaerales bacterium]|nr:SDR family oxidoreductase [Phycisphaerales bacterium]MCB9856979.1 SDR family oxidoreductase [Phycisphaerales bacterium]MCB9861894.1 SDR family oxidoreductase [Phycisphaerales bacterium]
MILNGKHCVVTGGSSGIGRAIVQRFAHEGARVTFSYLTKRESAESLVRTLGNTQAYQMNVQDRSQVDAFLNTCVARHGHIDVLVNNAGINRPADFCDQSDAEWIEVLDVNLVGPFRVLQIAIPLLSEKASVINIGSLSGQYGGPRTPSYAASKAGVMALTHCAARFLAPRGIRVNCLSPGVVANEFTAATMSESVKTIVEQLLLLKRPAEPEEIAAAAVFLASDESQYLTAQTLGVNGGAWV